MILIDLQLQVIVCVVCREHLEIPRSLLRDQHALLELKDDTRRDHRECARWPEDVARAMRERGYRKRMEKELRRAQAKARPAIRTRCKG